MGRYPREGDKDCKLCGKRIILRAKYDRTKIFCDRKCSDEHRRRVEAEKMEASKIPCKQCGVLFKSYENAVFCSPTCASMSRRVYYDRVCQTCGKEFQVRNVYEIKRGDHKYCSLECYKRKYTFVEVDFNKQSHETMYWLGFMFATVSNVEETQIELDADEASLFRLVKYLNGNMVPVKCADLYRLTLYSRPFVRKMALIGLRDDLYQEAPIITQDFVMDFIRGFMDSPKGYLYRDGKDFVAALHGSDSKLMRWIADKTGGILTYKDKEWVVVCRNLPAICDGLPRNEDKWAKITSHVESVTSPSQ
jgi:hypothetical protein